MKYCFKMSLLLLFKSGIQSIVQHKQWMEHQHSSLVRPGSETQLGKTLACIARQIITPYTSVLQELQELVMDLIQSSSV